MLIKLSIHNGLGDIVKLFPFVQTLLLNEYKVTIQTCDYNHDFIRYFFNDKVELEDWVNHWYHTQDERYNKVINLNHLYRLNDACTWGDFDKHLNMGIHPLICYEFLRNGFIKKNFFPKEFTPSYLFDLKKEQNKNIIIFTKSTAGNRTLKESLVAELSEKYKDHKNVIINPLYDNKKDLAININNAKFVLTVDSGPLHISEACKTKYHALLTVNSYNKFMKYYHHGTYSYSGIECGPCNFHGNHCLEYGNKNYKCQDMFKIEDLVKIIDEQLD